MQINAGIYNFAKRKKSTSLSPFQSETPFDLYEELRIRIDLIITFRSTTQQRSPNPRNLRYKEASGTSVDKTNESLEVAFGDDDNFGILIMLQDLAHAAFNRHVHYLDLSPKFETS